MYKTVLNQSHRSCGLTTYPQLSSGMGTFGLTEAKRREPLPFILRGPFAPAQVSLTELGLVVEVYINRALLIPRGLHIHTTARARVGGPAAGLGLFHQSNPRQACIVV